MTNQLTRSTSPYLLQHADNPVDWWPWCPEAFDEARRRDVPVLLSVGYAACHWCHVMAHESFEDVQTAELMNEHFVNIKVDREERPDIDAVYMEATQAMMGQGGWPMTCFLTPAGEPFYCGTYFPKSNFHQLLHGVTRAWREQRADVLKQGNQVVSALTDRPAGFGVNPPPSADRLAAAAKELDATYDEAYGGFGGAPKFPPSMPGEFLLRHYARTGDERCLTMVGETCRVMSQGGMYDQLGGGFARYSVDARWIVPHFEKMLYDNALLLRLYAHWWRQTGDSLGRRIALETADWILRGLRTPQGGLASSLDADSEGEEGRYYAWDPAELREVLGEDDGDFAADVFTVTDPGTFEHGRSVLQLREEPVDRQRFARVRAALLAARDLRVPPARDDKVVAAWNGLAIAALAEAGGLFDRPDLVRAAEEIAELLTAVHLRDGRLARTSRDGHVGPGAGMLEDYADVAEGVCALHAVTGEARWVTLAGQLLDAVLTHFVDSRGDFYDAADDAERLFRRPQDPTDGATPSGRFAAAGALLSYAALTGSSRHREAAEAALGAVGPIAAQYPRFVGWGLAVSEAVLAGPLEVAIVGASDDPRTRELHRVALAAPSPGAVVTLGDPSMPTEVPLLDYRDLVDGAPAAYVCRGFVCQAPVTDPDDLRAALTAG